MLSFRCSHVQEQFQQLVTRPTHFKGGDRLELHIIILILDIDNIVFQVFSTKHTFDEQTKQQQRPHTTSTVIDIILYLICFDYPEQSATLLLFTCKQFQFLRGQMFQSLFASSNVKRTFSRSSAHWLKVALSKIAIVLSYYTSFIGRTRL